MPAGVQCKTGIGRITEAAVEQLETVTGNRQSALTALLNRLIYAHERVTVTSDEIDHVLTSLIERGFAGDSVAYQAALTQAGVTPPLARTLVADQLRRQEFEAIVQVRHATSSPGGFREQRQRDQLRQDDLPAGRAAGAGCDRLGPGSAVPGGASGLRLDPGDAVSGPEGDAGGAVRPGRERAARRSRHRLRTQGRRRRRSRPSAPRGPTPADAGTSV